MALHLTDEERAAVRERAEMDGISMQEAARQAVREFIARSAHRGRVSEAAAMIVDRHEVALRRLGD